ncbi:MAG TPA: hypothetical protein VHA06_17870 [Candidatus Angelobacter sp.]|jgi:hypothetical protein|nr:hypothetical protein [Candidatus Angelobacter sp.]
MKKLFAFLGSLLSLGGRALPPTLVNLASFFGRKRKHKGTQHPGSYVGCPKGKYDDKNTRQRRRARATATIMKEVRGKFDLPRRIARSIVRTRVNREWRAA